MSIYQNDKNKENQPQKQPDVKSSEVNEPQQNTQAKEGEEDVDIDLYREEHGDLTNDNT